VAIAYISLGSNLGRKKANIRRAVKLLGKKKDVKILKVSSLYETEPVGYVKQDWFVNAVLKAETNLSPRQLLTILKDIEKKLKRKKRLIRWGPRTIDLDILLYDNLRLKTKDLVIPHPEMHKRAFVLIPLMELEPNLVHPTKRKSILELLANLRVKKEVKKI
jgi:2-amino-4-hydroxy-6-hydroxymethyldihydropteridine diphosphokinase